MARPEMIAVPLPGGIHPTSLDQELLRATFEAIVALRFETSREWEEALHKLERDGWEVHWGLTWHAHAHRGKDFEQASGKTLDETFNELVQLARLDAVCHVP